MEREARSRPLELEIFSDRSLQVLDFIGDLAGAGEGFADSEISRAI